MSVSDPAYFMAHALRLAERGRYTTFPNPRVGCVIVRDGAIVGEGWHERAGEPHAEVHALRSAGDKARGAEVFVTLEPCSHHGRTPPCADALVAAGVRKLRAAMRDPNPRVAGQGIEQLRAAGIEVEVGLLESAARELNRGFISRMERGRPFVTLKLAASLDGRTAMANGESKWITSEAARADVHRLRAEAGAVLTSSETVLADNPALTVRTGYVVARQPDRIVLDSRGRVPASARVWSGDGARQFWCVIAVAAAVCRSGASRDNPPKMEQPLNLQAAVAACAAPTVTRIEFERNSSGRLSLPQVLRQLAGLEINSVLVECGPKLAGAFLRDGLADELIAYLAPSLLGDSARGLATLPGLEKLDQRVRLKFTDVRQVGTDLRITAVPLKGDR